MEAFSVPGEANAARLKAGRWRESNTCARCGAWRGGFGLEPTIEMYIAHTLVILAELWRVLRPDGVVFWNVGDSYANASQSGGGDPTIAVRNLGGVRQPKLGISPGLKAKDLCLIPERFALAAQAAGWWVRSRILWTKPNPMPESVTDRPTDAAEHIWMFTKGERYFWDSTAVRETTALSDTHSRGYGNGGPKAEEREREGHWHNWADKTREIVTSRNLRNVWTFATQPYPDAHFATFPEELPRRCIKAATSERGACLQCGTPWVRVTDRDIHFEGGSGAAMSRNPESWKGSTFDGERDLQVRPNTQRRTDKQAEFGKRTYTGFNDRWDAKERSRLDTAKGAGGDQIESGDYDIRMGPVLDVRT